VTRLAVSVLLVVWSSPAAFAQEPAHAADTAAPVEQIDLVDAWRQYRHKPVDPNRTSEPEGLMIAAAPVIGFNPTFGVTFGAAAQIAFVSGDPTTTRISSSVSSLSYSTKNQVLFNARFDVFTNENRWFIEGDNRVYKSGQTVYGLGADTPSAAGIDATYNFVRLHETVYRHVGRGVYLGAGLAFDSYSSIAPGNGAESEWSDSPFVTYSQAHGLPLDSQQSAGLTVNLVIDRRLGEIDPRGGWLLSVFYRTSFDGFLGGDSSWDLAHVEARGYIPLSRQMPETSRVPARHRLALWAFGDMSTSGAVPYFDLPPVVSDTYARSSRAYQLGRYRGERLAYGEVEYRGMLTANGLLGMVAFANTATVSNLAAGERLFDAFATGAGAGLRVLFNKRSRTNFCVDVAFGKAGAHGVYFAIQDAF
jgi:hypothetical protein